MNPDDAVSAILPVRNEEAAVERAVLSLAAQPEIREILVVNDQSTDGTARRAGATLGRGAETSGVGRGAFAGRMGGQESRGLAGRAARQAALAAFHRRRCACICRARPAGRWRRPAATGAAMISYSPAQEMHTWWERALIPFVYCRLAQLYSYAAVNDPESPAAAANGQYLLIRRDAYDAIGGHASRIR